MAKVDGPLMPIEARGKLADSLVYFPWKGRHVVRQWLKPTNPQSTIQGYVRSALKAIGKFITKIVSVSNGGALDSRLYVLATSKAPAGMNWNAHLGAGFLDLLQTGGTFLTTNFLAKVSAYSALVSTALTAFKTNATVLGIADFTFEYGYTTNIEAGCILYFGALAAVAQSVSTGAPYNTAVGSWVAADVDAFKTDMVATN